MSVPVQQVAAELHCLGLGFVGEEQKVKGVILGEERLIALRDGAGRGVGRHQPGQRRRRKPLRVLRAIRYFLP